jgi:hypothetical protein
MAAETVLRTTGKEDFQGKKSRARERRAVASRGGGGVEPLMFGRLDEK